MFTSTKLYQELIKKLKTFGCVLTEHLGDPQLEAVHLFFFFSLPDSRRFFSFGISRVTLLRLSAAIEGGENYRPRNP